MKDDTKALIGLAVVASFLGLSALAFSRKPAAGARIIDVYSSQDMQAWDSLNGAILALDSYYLGVSWINQSSVDRKSILAELNLVGPDGSPTPYQLVQSTLPNQEVLVYLPELLLSSGSYILECDIYEEVSMTLLDSKSVAFSVQAAPPPAQGQITNATYQLPGSSQQFALAGASFLFSDIGKTITIFVTWKNIMASGSLKLNTETVITCILPNQTTVQCPITSGIGVTVTAGNSGVLQTTLKLTASGNYVLKPKIGA